MTLTVTIPAPAAWIRSNDHTHYRNRHALTAAWREAAGWQAMRTRAPSFGFGPVHVTATIHRQDKRRYDLDGIAPTVKACIDGLRDAGVLAEDDCEVITRLTIQAGEPHPGGSVVLTVTADSPATGPALARAPRKARTAPRTRPAPSSRLSGDFSQPKETP